jgi:hypothetical protein
MNVRAGSNPDGAAWVREAKRKVVPALAFCACGAGAAVEALTMHYLPLGRTGFVRFDHSA